jgi:WD40 repeat protein
VITDGADEHVRFPALDPEPPPRSWRWRAASAGVTVAAAAGLAAVVLLVLWLTGGSRSATGAAPGVGGKVLFLSTSGSLGVASPDGSGVRNLAGLGSHALNGGAQAIPSLDGSYVVTADGAVFYVAGGTVSPRRSSLDLAAEQQFQLSYDNPFTDADEDLVLLAGGPGTYGSTDAGVSLFNWRTGTPAGNLGNGDQIAGPAGDPQGSGAIVPVAAPAGSAGEADSRVELRDLGRPAVVLVTAGSVDRALGRSPDLAVVLSPFPDPAGDKIAIIASAAQPGLHPSAGVVVVDRSGHLLSSLTGTAPPESGYGVEWSPDGKSLLYVALGTSGQEAVVWNSGSGTPLTRPLPNPGDNAAYCIWSPDGTEVLCATVDLQSRAVTWVTGSSGAGPLLPHPGPGVPVEFVGTRR